MRREGNRSVLQRAAAPAMYWRAPRQPAVRACTEGPQAACAAALLCAAGDTVIYTSSFFGDELW